MRDATGRDDGRTGGRAVERAREARRMIGRERDYHCSECGFQRRSWLALHSCPSCGSGFAEASVVRAVLG